MSTSTALPVLRTPDPHVAHAAARRLLALAEAVADCNTEGVTTALTAAEARRLFAAFPEARATPIDLHRTAVREAATPGVEALLPLEFQVQQPAGTFEERFLDAIGSGPGSLS
ncbi:hypothetical protein [Kitasatospora sp. NPDC089509]|uniref:hypothetical protein n=1 Tax=Kitasatospora sp. NPDC089509 TaxID=3364079 RepID=UPI00382E929F